MTYPATQNGPLPAAARPSTGLPGEFSAKRLNRTRQARQLHDRLAHLALRTRRYAAQETFVPDSDHVYYVCSGVLAVVAVHVDGEDGITEFLAAPDLLQVSAGDICYYECLTVEDTTVWDIDAQRLAASSDGIQLMCQRQATRLDWLRAWAACQQRVSVEDRLWGILHLLAEEFGTNCADGTVIDLPLTHRLLASATGSTRSTMTRTVNRFLAERRLHQDSWFGATRYVLPAV
jgi:CRP-like cAMP-binding protein